jgi:hypothetical protein
MPFFFIVPLWLMFLVVGTILLFFPNLRRAGYFVIAIPTGATIASFLLSTAVLIVVPRLMPQPARSWYGIFLVATYLASIALGALLGALGAFFAIVKLRRTR